MRHKATGPSLTGLVIDLPAAARTELARDWGTDADARALLQKLTDPDALADVARRLDPAASSVLHSLALEPARIAGLIARLPFAGETTVAAVEQLGRLGLVAAMGGVRGRFAVDVGPDERLAVPREIVRALGWAR